MLIHELEKKGLITPPSWFADNVSYLTIMGSVAYSVSNDTSDMDIYGFCVPKKTIVFPHLAGEISDFGTKSERFEQLQLHHVHDKDAMAGKGRVYDLTIYGIVKYFNLCMQCNPNMIDSIFTPETCVLHSTPVGNMVRENRKLFLSKHCWATFKGYAYAQLHKMNTKCHAGLDDLIEFEKQNSIARTTTLADVEKEVQLRKDGSLGNFAELSNATLLAYYSKYKLMIAKGKRSERVKISGFDLKFAYHVVRLLNECQQILLEGDIDLQRNREELKAIRRGEWTEGQIYEHFENQTKLIEKIYAESKLRQEPDEPKIKQLLVNCLEEHFGSIDKSCVVLPDLANNTLKRIDNILKSAKKAGLEF